MKPHFTLITSLEALSPNVVYLEVKALIHECEGHTIQSITDDEVFLLCCGRGREPEITRQWWMSEARLVGAVVSWGLWSPFRARGWPGREKREEGESVKTDPAG